MTKNKGGSFDGGPIGYKRPPAEHQFRKGHKRVGGRRNGQKNFSTLVEELLNSLVTVSENGEPREMSFKEALLLKAGSSAMRGSLPDIDRFFKLIERLAPKEVEPEQLVVQFQKIPGDDW